MQLIVTVLDNIFKWWVEQQNNFVTLEQSQSILGSQISMHWTASCIVALQISRWLVPRVSIHVSSDAFWPLPASPLPLYCKGRTNERMHGQTRQTCAWTGHRLSGRTPLTFDLLRMNGRTHNCSGLLTWIGRDWVWPQYQLYLISWPHITSYTAQRKMSKMSYVKWREKLEG